MSKLREKIIQGVVKKIVSLLPNVSNENLIRLTYLAEKIDFGHSDIIAGVRHRFEINHPSVELGKYILRRLNNTAREKLAVNFFINACLLGLSRRKAFEKKYGFLPPFLIVISPSMRCNLNCKGCYAGEYTKGDELSFELVDRVVQEAKEMGIYFITISGGEPYLWEGLLDLFEKHNDVYFQTYTNGTLIDEKMADELARLGNVCPAISVEGFEPETDDRRGKAIHKKVLRAMSVLKERGVMFGFSTTPTRYNSDLVSSDEFIDYYIDKGCLFGWYFQYVPIGRNPDVRIMATPEQRDMLRRRVLEIRATKPIFIGDFWNDGPFVNGCIAGGRAGEGYLHINCKGDVEPCVFVHFAVDNIKEKPLREVLQSDFFKAIRRRQPYRPNLLLPCMIIDNPWVLREVVKEGGARPTHPGAETIIGPEIGGFLDRYACEYARYAEAAFREYKKVPEEAAVTST